jgi:oligopeptide transport system permease protein
MKNKVLETLLKSKITIISFVVLFVIVAMCIFVPMFYPTDYYAHIDLENVSKAPSVLHIFGTDHLGRDIFIRTLEGGRISLEIALIATLVSILIGTIYGAISGYMGGKIDAIMMRIVDALYAIPFLFFSILLMTLFNRDFRMMFVAIAFVSWLDIARIVRGQTIGIK